MNENHIENSIGRIREIFQKASAKIESLKVGQKIPATALAEEIGKQYGMTGPQLYPILLMLIKGYPGVDIKRGAHGGIIKLPIVSSSVKTETKTITEEIEEPDHILIEPEYEKNFVKEDLPIIDT